ncbi:MAG: GNAT family N-acetyltransferase [Parvularculaceae bacterium]|nr:GNAT family N-acetyltransferase [Parvularculaceae bacterium]
MGEPAGASMLKLDFVRPVSKPTELTRAGLRLRPPQLADHPQWWALRENSRHHLTRWEPDWTERDVTIDAFRTRVRLQERLRRSGAALTFFACLADEGAIIGGVTLSDIRLHAAHSATLGYWIGEPYLRRGYGAEAVAAVVDYGFGELRLNRIEAACQPGNVASLSLLRKLGFREEGFARDYLFINGAWRDHLLFALTARDYCGAPLRF